MLRSPRLRWWRPLAALGVAGAALLIVELAISVVVGLLAFAAGVDISNVRALTRYMTGTPVGFLFIALSLAVIIPIVLVTVRLIFGTPMGFLVSVQGRFRWRWAVRCLLCVFPIWAIVMVVSVFTGQFTGGPHRHWLIMMILVVLLIPLQAAGEEFGFRGFIQQVVGSWFGNRWLALIIPAVASIPAFAAAHGSTDLWVFADLAVFAASTVYLTWRTGGLEAAIAIHAMNNVLLMLTGLALGGFEAGFVSSDTSGSWFEVLISLVSQVVAVVVISWQARRAGIQRMFAPKPPPRRPTSCTGHSVDGLDHRVGVEGPPQGLHGGDRQWPGQDLGHRAVGQSQPGPGPGWQQG